MPIRFLDMFAGIGGFRSGLERLGGYECVGYCEIDKYAKQAYDAMYPTEGELYFADARTIDPYTLPDIDLICGGFPCQSFSIAGLRRGFQDDTRGTLFFEIARIAAVKRPPFLLLENVPGLLSHDQLMGIKTFTKYGLSTNKGELLFYLVSPTNISVLSHTNIEIKIRHLMMVLSALPDIEIVCTDSSECFDDNKAYLTERLEVEENAKVRKLIKKDIDFLDTIQVEMATARQFFFVARLKGQKEKQVFETANRIESKIAGEGFEVHRLKKPEIKRILALYFDASMQGEAMPDIDGEQFYEVTDDEDEE